ncbi:MAG: Sapep family Mn(2+)-dependent dipeptidase [Bullifex sp.]
MEINRELEESVNCWIAEHADEYLDVLSALIRIKSVSLKGEQGFPYGKGCHDVLAEAEKIARGYGFECINHGDRYLLIRYGNNSDKKIGVFNHLDVVPEGKGWENPPYEMTVRDGFVIGRGTADNKGAAVSSLFALRYLKDHSVDLKHPVELFFGTAEETGMEDIEYYLRDNEAPYFSLVPDSDFPVCHGEKGNMRFTLSVSMPETVLDMSAGEVINAVPSYAEAVLNGTFSISHVNVICENAGGKTYVKASGKAGHAAFPEQSDNAVRTLFSALAEIDTGNNELNDTFRLFSEFVSTGYGDGLGIKISDEPSGPLTAMGTVLRMNDRTMTLSFDARTPVSVSTETIDKKLRALAEEKGITYTLESCSVPCYTPLDSEIVRLLCRVAEHIHGPGLEPYTMGGGTYCRKLPFALGFGPGLRNAPNLFSEGKGHGHQSDECILLSLLLDDIKAAILALTGLDRII